MLDKIIGCSQFLDKLVQVGRRRCCRHRMGDCPGCLVVQNAGHGQLVLLLELAHRGFGFGTKETTGFQLGAGLEPDVQLQLKSLDG